MKLILILLIFLQCSYCSALSLENEIICAMSSIGAYSDEAGELGRRSLENRGWRLDKLSSPSESINVKMHFMSLGNSKVFFLTGTEDIKDIEIDMKVKPVDFNVGKVHGGFKEYADAALSGGMLEFLVEYMANHPNEEYYFTGHSLGGAIATLIAARLADSGADMARIQVVTFGAPAVGNRNFADFYSDKINLTRIVMESDPIEVSLKLFGYVQFGEVLRYKAPETEQHSHSMSLYLDGALRRFYDAGLNFESTAHEKSYIAPIKIVSKSFSAADEKYAKMILRDGYTSRFKNVNEISFDEIKKAENMSYSVRNFTTPATALDSEYIITPLIYTKMQKETREKVTRIVLEEIIYDKSGRLITMKTAGMTTATVTILDALFLLQEYLRENQ